MGHVVNMFHDGIFYGLCSYDYERIGLFTGAQRGNIVSYTYLYIRSIYPVILIHTLIAAQYKYYKFNIFKTLLYSCTIISTRRSRLRSPVVLMAFGTEDP